MRFALAVAGLVVMAQPLVAQAPGDTAGVRAAVLDYVEGFYEGDTTRLLRSIAPNVFKYGYWRAHRDSAYAGEQMAFPREFLSYANAIRTGRSRTPANAPKVIQIFDVVDQTASAKLTAWWGIDYLLLAKNNGRWQITHVLWQSPPPR